MVVSGEVEYWPVGGQKFQGMNIKVTNLHTSIITGIITGTTTHHALVQEG